MDYISHSHFLNVFFCSSSAWLCCELYISLPSSVHHGCHQDTGLGMPRWSTVQSSLGHHVGSLSAGHFEWWSGAGTTSDFFFHPQQSQWQCHNCGVLPVTIVGNNQTNTSGWPNLNFYWLLSNLTKWPDTYVNLQMLIIFKWILYTRIWEAFLQNYFMVWPQLWTDGSVITSAILHNCLSPSQKRLSTILGSHSNKRLC